MDFSLKNLPRGWVGVRAGVYPDVIDIFSAERYIHIISLLLPCQNEGAGRVPVSKWCVTVSILLSFLAILDF